MKNLTNQFDNLQASELASFKNDLLNNEGNKLLNMWFYKSLIPKNSPALKFEGDDLKNYLLKRYVKKQAKERVNFVNRVNLLNAEVNTSIDKLTISIEWVKSKTWGANPRGEGTAHLTPGFCKSYTASGVTGCGYDKLSTAVANILNQCTPILAKLAEYKEKNGADLKNSELLGYGAGYGILPTFEGGVGCECYPKILEKIGLNFERVFSSKNTDIYLITPIK